MYKVFLFFYYVYNNFFTYLQVTGEVEVDIVISREVDMQAEVENALEVEVDDGVENG